MHFEHLCIYYMNGCKVKKNAKYQIGIKNVLFVLFQGYYIYGGYPPAWMITISSSVLHPGHYPPAWRITISSSVLHPGHFNSLPLYHQAACHVKNCFPWIHLPVQRALCPERPQECKCRVSAPSSITKLAATARPSPKVTSTHLRISVFKETSTVTIESLP